MSVLIAATRVKSRLTSVFFARVLPMAALLFIFGAQAGSGGSEKPARQYFTDVTLINQAGRQQALYTDLLQDKVVIIHSFFTTCKSACPVSMKLMTGIAQRFADDMGKNLFILSFSLDPETDTPLKLQAYARELNTGPGWQLISGSKENVEFALKKLGHYVDDIEDHKNTLILGNEATGLWKKAFLLAKPDALDSLIREVLTDKLPVTAALD
ncbi:SCO family protein [Thalassomonas actiniarum]|uniref:SCO family protein n=1 Tax=Thalassomonas actiniarum TaxID=485447 RepID=A0AAF0C697_9GAMM|nr:SCO family protein [Thalassomonas actiniarum]WDE01649.1 SCO family protein [Thalassomonas actiniarum]